MFDRKGSFKRCSSSCSVSTRLLLSFLALSPSCIGVSEAAYPAAKDQLPPQLPIIPPDSVTQPPHGTQPRPLSGDHGFTLRHIFHHGTYVYPELHKRRDVSADGPLWMLSDNGERKEIPTLLKARSRPLSIHRLADRRPSTVNPLLAAARRDGGQSSYSGLEWSVDEIPGPDHTDKETVLTLARAAANAYVGEPGTGEWEDVNGSFNYSESFGWREDGLRGHIFVDETNSTIIMGLKGTSTAVFDGAETTTNDKENDNLFFSCCCGQGGRYLWRQVCDCASGTYRCNETCLAQELKADNRYYKAAKDLYGNVTSLYPDADIWLAGHSLGGSISAFLGLTYGVPVFTFESVPDALPARRLNIPSPPGSDPGAPQAREMTGAFHFGHTADPIFMGVCNGATSGCSIAGYALESVCHTGQECVYDVVEDKGWRVSIGMHRIHRVIDEIIEDYDKVPECKTNTECYDCYNWKFFESNGSDTTTSTTTSTSRTRTRTSTCKTPGWFGCLDPTTTATVTATSSSSTEKITTTTATCSSYGWFGNCLDPTTTTTTVPASKSTFSNSRAARPAPSTDITKPHRGPSTVHSLTLTSPPPSSQTLVSSSPTPSKPSSRNPSSPNLRCVRRRFWWFGHCAEWQVDGDGRGGKTTM